jgi:hypothetical protein
MSQNESAEACHLAVSPDPSVPQVASLITMPVLLIALLKSGDFSVHLAKARDGSSIWYFRFSPKALLEVGDDGRWCWRRGPARWRRTIAPFIAAAEALAARGPLDGG